MVFLRAFFVLSKRIAHLFMRSEQPETNRLEQTLRFRKRNVPIAVSEQEKQSKERILIRMFRYHLHAHGEKEGRNNGCIRAWLIGRNRPECKEKNDKKKDKPDNAAGEEHIQKLIMLICNLFAEFVDERNTRADTMSEKVVSLHFG